MLKYILIISFFDTQNYGVHVKGLPCFAFLFFNLFDKMLVSTILLDGVCIPVVYIIINNMI